MELDDAIVFCKIIINANTVTPFFFSFPRKSKLWSQCWIMTRSVKTTQSGRSGWAARRLAPSWSTGPTCWPTLAAPSLSGIHCSPRRRLMLRWQPWTPRSKPPLPTNTHTQTYLSTSPLVIHISQYYIPNQHTNRFYTLHRKIYINIHILIDVMKTF